MSIQILKAEDLFNWINQQPDDSPIVMNQSSRGENYTVGCILMQYSDSLGIKADVCGWQDMRHGGEILDPVCFAKFEDRHPDGRYVVEDFVIKCNRSKCLTFADAKQILKDLTPATDPPK